MALKKKPKVLYKCSYCNVVIALDYKGLELDYCPVCKSTERIEEI